MDLLAIYRNDLEYLKDKNHTCKLFPAANRKTFSF